MLKSLIFILITQSLLQDSPHFRRVENLACFNDGAESEEWIWNWFGTASEIGVLFVEFTFTSECSLV